MQRREEIYLDVLKLKERGWTESLIKKFLKEPDDWESVNHYANFTGKRLYSLGRVLKTESSDEYKKAFLKSARRRGLTEDELKNINKIRTKSEKKYNQMLIQAL